MVTSSNQPAVHEPVQVAEAYSYLASEQKEITLDSIPLPPTPPPLSASKDQESSSSNILEQTIIKQKRLARFKNTDLRRKILLKRTFDLVCEIMDHENGFDFEDETETIRDKRPQAPVSSKKEEADDEDSDDEEDESGSDSESDSSSDDSDSESDDSSSSSDDESDDEEEEEEPRSASKCHDDTDIDQQIPKQSESMNRDSKQLAEQQQHQSRSEASPENRAEKESNESFSQTKPDPVPSLCSQASDESSEDLDFTELNSVDITESYDDSAFNLDQVTYEPSSVSYEEPPVKTSLKRKRNSFEETVHQNEHDFYFGTSPSTCCETRNSDQELFCSNAPLGSLSDSTCFYNNQTTGLETPVKTLKRSLGDEAESSKRLKSN